MVVVRVIAVFAALEQRAELDGLVRLVMVHRAHVEPGQPQRQTGRQGDRDEGAEPPARHFARP